MPLKNSGRSVADWAPSLKKATDACVLASNNASPAGAEGPPEGCSTAPRHAACGAPVPSSRGHFLSFGGDRNQLQRRDADGARCDSERRWRAAADRRQSIRRFLQLLAVRRVERALRAARPLGLGR